MLKSTVANTITIAFWAKGDALLFEKGFDLTFLANEKL